MIKWLIKLTGSEKSASLILVVIVAAIVAMLCAASYWRGYRAADQRATVKELRTSNKQLQSDLDHSRSTITQLEKLQNENDQRTQTLLDTKGKERIVYRTIRSKAAQYQKSIPASPTGAVCVVDPEYVRLWNAALFADTAIRVPEATGIVSRSIADTGATDISQQDLLNNHIDNSEISIANFKQCSALIEWHHQHDNKATP